MKAMILAAGYGERLRPLTYLKAKALFPVLNRPLLDLIIEQLQRAGITEIVVNTHYLGDQIAKFLKESDQAGLTIHVLREEVLLGTGGGLRNAERFLNEGPFLVINGDIFTTIDLKAAYDFHIASANPVTMVLHHYPEYGNVRVDNQNLIRGFSDRSDGQMAFTGIHIINPDVFSFIPPGGYYDILDAYRIMISKGAKIGAFEVSGHYWKDIGTIGAYLALHGDLLTGTVNGIGDLFPGDIPVRFGKDLSIGEGVEFIDWVSLGDRVCVESHVRLARTVIWEGARVKTGSQVADTVIPGIFPGD